MITLKCYEANYVSLLLQITVSPCVCSVIDHRRRQNVSGINVSNQLARRSLAHFVLTTF